ncbi:MAG: acyltransferase family protein [Chloroflexota bacterium]
MTGSARRRNDLDWLRVLAVLLLVPFHAALIFVQNPYSIMYVKDTVNSRFLDAMAGCIHQFHMPLLFVVAGMTSFLALGVRSWSQYLQERFTRLFIPLLFGVVFLLPPMTYLTQLSRGRQISFWQHYQGFFRIDPAHLDGIGGTFTPAHLWFILYLFLFSLLALPFFVQLRRLGSQAALRRLAGFFEKPLAVFLFALPLALAASIDLLGDKNPLVYFSVFFFGYVLMTDERYQQAIDRHTWLALLVGVFFQYLRLAWRVQAPEWSALWIVYGLMEQFNRWLWVLGILGLGHRFLTRGGKVLAYLTASSFPFYILHLPVTTLVGYGLIRLPLGWMVKYPLIVLLSTLATFLVYEAARRVAPLRFALGMKTPARRLALDAAAPGA